MTNIDELDLQVLDELYSYSDSLPDSTRERVGKLAAALREKPAPYKIHPQDDPNVENELFKFRNAPADHPTILTILFRLDHDEVKDLVQSVGPPGHLDIAWERPDGVTIFGWLARMERMKDGTFQIIAKFDSQDYLCA